MASGWAVLAIFVAIVLGLILQLLLLGAVVLLGLMVILITKVFEFSVVLSGFVELTIWLIVVAFFISIGFLKIGFG